MRKFAGLAVFCILASAAAPLFAGTVYVPLAFEDDVFHTQVLVSNRSAAVRRISTFFIEDGKDGTKGRDGAADPSYSVGERATVLLTGVTPAGKLGLLEITGAPQVVLAARLVAQLANQETVIGVGLPVITSENLFAANSAAELQGLERSAQRFSNQVLVNLGQVESQCTVSLWRSAGTQIGTSAVLTMPPLSQRAFPDVLGLLGETAISAVRVAVSCTQPFYTFALVLDPQLAEAAVILPSAVLDSKLEKPKGGGGGGPSNCPDGAQCFIKNGEVFTTTTAKQHEYFKWFVDAGTEFQRFEVTFKMRLNKWDRNKNGFYTIFYLNRNGKWLEHGYALLVAREKGVVKAEVTADLPKGDIQGSSDSSADLKPGETYEVYYVYDAENRFFEVKMTDSSGKEVVSIFEKLWTTTRRIESSGWFGIQFSDPYISGTDHVPLWATWSNLVIAGFE